MYERFYEAFNNHYGTIKSICQLELDFQLWNCDVELIKLILLDGETVKKEVGGAYLRKKKKFGALPLTQKLRPMKKSFGRSFKCEFLQKLLLVFPFYHSTPPTPLLRGSSHHCAASKCCISEKNLLIQLPSSAPSHSPTWNSVSI